MYVWFPLGTAVSEDRVHGTAETALMAEAMLVI